MTREEMVAVLRATPEKIAHLARDLSVSQTARPPAPDEWSMGQTLDHLVRGERDLILPRLRRMHEESAPDFPSSTPTRTGFAAAPRAGDFMADLAAFKRVRDETLAFLGRLREADWQRIGTTPTRGTLTIEAYARYLAEHDLEHLTQMEATRVRVTG